MRKGAEREKGFTMIELMIVLIIMGVLAAIAIPKYMGVIGKAESSEAKNHLSNLVNLETAYFYRNNSYFPFDITDPGESVTAIGFEVPEKSMFSYQFVEEDGDWWAVATEIGDIDGDGVSGNGELRINISKTVQQTTGTFAW